MHSEVMVHKSKTESTWQQGVNAFRAGLRREDNPYAAGNGLNLLPWELEMDACGWDRGWLWGGQSATASSHAAPVK